MIELYDHQKRLAKSGLNILQKYKILYLAMEVRTGKSITALEIAKLYGAKNVLFITKLKAIPSITNDHKLMGKPIQNLDLVNFERLRSLKKKYDLIILDEAHSIGGFPKASAWAKSIRALAHDLPIIYLSGTPNPNSYSQLFHQYWVSSYGPWKSYRNFYAWAIDYVKVYERMIAGMMKKQYDRAIIDKILADTNLYTLTCSQEEAGFQCHVKEYVRWVPMPTLLKSLADDIHEDHMAEWDHNIVTCANGGDIMNKRSQLSGGTIICDDEEDGIILDDSKAEYIRKAFRGKRLAILYLFRAEEQALLRHFPNTTKSPELFNSGQYQTFIGQISSVREGINLATADAMILYNISFSARSYFQLRARLQVRDKVDPVPLYWIFYDRGIEPMVYKRVQSKKDFTWKYFSATKEAQSPPDLTRPKFQSDRPISHQLSLSFDDMIKLTNQL